MAAAAMAAGVSGCRSEPERADRRTQSPARTTPVYTDRDRDEGFARPVAFQDGQPRTTPSAQMGTTSATIDNVLRVTKRMPREVRAGNVFEYEITVENVSDMMLADVAIREHDAAGMSSPGEFSGRSGQMGRPDAMAPAGRPMLQREQQPMARPMQGLDEGARPVRQELDGPVTAPIQGQREPMLDDEPMLDRSALDEPVMRPVGQPMQQPLPPQGWDPMEPGINQGRLGQDDPRLMQVGALQQQPGAMGREQGGMHGFGSMQEIYIGTLGPRESRTVTVTGSVPRAGEFVICTSAAYTPMVCAMGVAIQPELALTKVGPEFASVGETIQYELTVRNTGIGAASNVRILDPLPGPMRTAQGQTEAQFDVGTLNAGQSRTFTVTAVAPEPGRYTNIARVQGADGLWDEAQAVTLIRAPQLRVEKIGPELDYTDVGVTFEISVTNVGDAPAQNVVLEDIIPPGVRLIDASGNARTTDGRVTWEIGTLGPEETRTVLVQMEGQQTGLFENCVIARADRLEPVRDCWTVRLEGVTGLRLELVDVNDPIRVGENEVYTIRVTNQGTALATQVTMDVQLDPNMELVSSEGATPGARTAEGLSFASLPSLAPGASAVWTVVTRGVGAGDTRFRVALRAAELERPVIAGESTRVFE